MLSRMIFFFLLNLKETFVPVFPGEKNLIPTARVMVEPDRATARVCHLFNYDVQTAFQPAYEVVDQLRQGYEGGETQITEKQTQSGTPWFLQENPQKYTEVDPK